MINHLPIQDDISTAPAVISITASHVAVAQHVAIILAAYNGGQFIGEQIRSIQEQKFPDWVLYLRDDCSIDDTVQKVLQIESADSRVKLVRDELGNLGLNGNFSYLMQVALEKNADYVFFSDQDDVWHPDKLSTMLAAIQLLETTYGVQTPLLVHCDLIVANLELGFIADSFVQYSRLSPTTADLGVLLCQNQVTGCACVVNRTLLELACPVPLEVPMHDWWLALLASSAGKIGYIPKPLVTYRQHRGNVVGAVSFGRRIRELIFSSSQWRQRVAVVRCGIRQAAMLEERIKARGIKLPAAIMKQINIYWQILNTSPLRRACLLHSHKIGRPSKITGIVFDTLITVIRRAPGGKAVD